MKAINLRQALIEANNVNLNGGDALVETSVLKQLIESCKARVEELEPEAKKLAEEELAKIGAKKGKFEYEGHHYTMDREEVYDMVGKPQKYTMSEGVEYRQKYYEQAQLRHDASNLTKDMKTILDKFPGNHPNIEPDEVKKTLKCLD